MIMASTRQNAVFQIYQDNYTPQPTAQPTSKPRPQLQPSAMPLQAMANPPQYSDVTINPPLSAAHHLSPLKSQPLSPQMQQFPHMNYVSIPAPASGHMYTGSPMKQPQMQQFSETLPSQPMFGTFNSNLEAYPQQEFHIASLSRNESSDFPVASYARRQNLKRSFSDAAPIHDRPAKRLKAEEESQLPDPEDMPPVEDDGNKPGYSYAQMIGMAILRAPHRRLTLAQIYEWISSTFAFYRDDPKQGWHNSIRHNLSLNKAFKRQERPKGDAGKGSYWIIEPGMEAQFFKEKVRKNTNIVSIGIQNGIRADIHVMAQPLAEAMTPSWSVPVPSVIPPRPQTAPALPDLSSDATLPASDPALHEEAVNEDVAQSPQQASSPAPVMNSSPPVASAHHRTISSPVLARPSGSRLHKRSNTAIDDSGYWTELSSSVRKSKVTKASIMLTSEINIERPQSKPGRAEDEIRRILSSPRATPNPRRLSAMSDLGNSSSPVRPSPASRHPTTPAVIFKKPALKPPPSVSPNTQLLRHRAQMLEYQDSPIKVAGISDSTLPGFSPYAAVPASCRNEFDEQFLIFEDALAPTPLTPGIGSSPVRSIRRPALPRSNTSTGVLRDVSNGNRLNAKTPTKVPSLKPAFKPIILGGSPLKKSMISIADDDIFAGLETFDENTFVNDDFDTTLINDENSSDFGDDGVDLGKGFAFIGQTQDISGMKRLSPVQRKISASTSRPVLGARSNTTAF